MGSGQSTGLSKAELEDRLSAKDISNLKVIRDAWHDLDAHFDKGTRGKMKTHIEDLLVRGVEETCPASLHVTVIRAVHLKTPTTIDVADPYVLISCNDVEFRTRSVKDSLTPVWNESFEFVDPGILPGSRLYFNVFDKNESEEDTLMGSLSVVVQATSGVAMEGQETTLILSGGQGMLSFRSCLLYPHLKIQQAISFDQLLAAGDEALDTIARQDPSKSASILSDIVSYLSEFVNSVNHESQVVVREEIRCMSAEGKQRYVQAVLRTMEPDDLRNGAVTEASDDTAETSQYFRVAGYHGWPGDFCAHRAETFPSWHRAYLLEFERELRIADFELGNDGNIGLPYWDFSKYELNGETIPKVFEDIELPKHFFKSSRKGKMFQYGYSKVHSDKVALEKLRSANIDDDFNACLEEAMHWKFASSENRVGKPIETPHNSAHMVCGFPLTSLKFAAFHPLFYSIHCNVDRYMEKYLQMNPDSCEEMKNRQSSLASEEGKTDKFLQSLVPFRKITGPRDRPADDAEVFMVEDIMNAPTEDFYFCYDVLPAMRPPQMRAPPTFALFEDVDVVFNMLGEDGVMKSFELHVYLTKDPHAKISEVSDDIVYGGWVGAFGGKGESCKNCRETLPVNLFVDVSVALQKLNCSRHDAYLKVLCVDEFGDTCSLEDVTATYGPKCVLPSPRLVGPLFESGSKSLSTGSQDKDVESLQQFLKQFGYYDGKVDGAFGPVTDKSLLAFQAVNGLKVDGIAGNITKEAMLLPRNDRLPDVNTAVDSPIFERFQPVKYHVGSCPGYLPSAGVLNDISLAFAEWGKALSMEFTSVSEKKDADIMLRWTDTSSINGFKFDGVGGAIAHAASKVIELDSNEKWSIAAESTSNTYSLRAVLLHEISHVLGMAGHSNDPQSVMSPYYAGNRLKLTEADISRAIAMYK